MRALKASNHDNDSDDIERIPILVSKTTKSMTTLNCIESIARTDRRARAIVVTLFIAACMFLAIWPKSNEDRGRVVFRSVSSSSKSLEEKSIESLPNIIIVYIDDQGYNDMGPNSTDLAEITPHINQLAQEGIWLTTYYGLHLCTPSRAALMTGKYPISTGMSHGVITTHDPWGLPLTHLILPNYLKKVGNYRTYMLGKWHLGHFNEAFTPLSRGFDRFYGYFSGFESYASHVAEANECSFEHTCYHDLRDNWTPVRLNVYNTYLFDREATKILDNQHEHVDANVAPFFLYYAIGNVHMPMEAPSSVFRERSEELQGILDPQRKTFAAMTTVLDDAVGNLTTGLIRNDMYENTFIIIASDNGANPTKSGSGSNWPLRGMKGTYWEGGVRVNALVRSSLIPHNLRGTTYDGIFHVTDWLPTLIGGVLGRKSIMRAESWDGVDQWDALLQRAPPPRSTVLYNIDVDEESDTTGALRIGDMKLLVNVAQLPVWSDPAIAGLEVHDAYLSVETADFLFNLTEDPTESKDLKEAYPAIYREMYDMFLKFETRATNPAFCGVGDNKQATKVFNETQFIAPWTDATIQRSCFIIGSAEEVEHNTEQMCRYGLLPSEKC